MTSSTSFLNRPAVIFLASLLYLSGCANAPEAGKRTAYVGEEKFRIAAYPIENLTGTAAPMGEIRQALLHRLEAQGFRLLKEETLEKFMAKHRIRYAGGIDKTTARAFREETGTEGVLITSLELYTETNPPKIALTSRLVSTGDDPAILWMDGVGLAGDDSPGMLGLGLIEDPLTLRQKALQLLSDSLTHSLSSQKDRVAMRGVKRKFTPKITYRSPELDPGGKYTVAIIPFLNRSERKNGGEIMELHFARHLSSLESFRVIEPGIVRQQLLGLRVIMEEGVSLADAEAIFGTLEADLILTGEVITYQDYQGVFGKPKVDFSALLLERKSRKIVWSSNSYNEGDDGVFFFDRGRVNTAHAMASKMARAVATLWVK